MQDGPQDATQFVPAVVGGDNCKQAYRQYYAAKYQQAFNRVFVHTAF